MQKNSRFTSDKAKHAKILRGVSSLVNPWNCVRDYRLLRARLFKGVRQLHERAVALVNWIALNRRHLFYLSASVERSGVCVPQTLVVVWLSGLDSFSLELLKIRALSRSALDTRSRDWRHIKWMFFSLSNITESRSCSFFSTVFWPRTRDKTCIENQCCFLII